MNLQLEERPKFGCCHVSVEVFTENNANAVRAYLASKLLRQWTQSLSSLVNASVTCQNEHLRDLRELAIKRLARFLFASSGPRDVEIGCCGAVARAGSRFPTS